MNNELTLVAGKERGSADGSNLSKRLCAQGECNVLVADTLGVCAVVPRVAVTDFPKTAHPVVLAYHCRKQGYIKQNEQGSRRAEAANVEKAWIGLENYLKASSEEAKVDLELP
jgi:hypothetical protein